MNCLDSDDDMEILADSSHRAQLPPPIPFPIVAKSSLSIALDQSKGESLKKSDQYPSIEQAPMIDPESIEPSRADRSYSFADSDSKMFLMKQDNSGLTSSKKKAFAFSFAGNDQFDSYGSLLASSANAGQSQGVFRGTFGQQSGDITNTTSKGTMNLLNSVVKEQKNDNQDGDGMITFDLNNDENNLDKANNEDQDKLPSFGNSSKGSSQSPSRLQNSVFLLNIPAQNQVFIPRLHQPSEISKKSSESGKNANILIRKSQNLLNRSIDKSQINLDIPIPAIVNYVDKIKREQSCQPQKEVESEEVEREIGSDDDKPNEASVEIDKSPLHDSYASEEQEERIVSIQFTTDGKIGLSINSTRDNYSKNISAVTIKNLEEYFESEFKTQVPLTAPALFSKPLSTVAVYLQRLFKFLQRQYQPFLLDFLKKWPENSQQSNPIQEGIWQHAWNIGKNIIHTIQKVPQSKLQKLHKFVECRILSAQKSLKARQQIAQLLQTQIQPCPYEAGSSQSTNKAFCLSEWLISLERGEKYLTEKKMKLSTDVRDKAEFDMYKKMANIYSAIMAKQTAQTKVQLQNEVQQLLTS